MYYNIFTMADVDDMQGFFIVPKHDYKLLQPGDKIKYRRTNGQMKAGGYIWYEKKNDQGRKFWMVSPSKEVDMNNRKISRYTVFWDQIDTLWQQNSVSHEIIKDNLSQRKSEIERLKNLIVEQQLVIKEMQQFLDYKFGEEFARHRRSTRAKTDSTKLTPKPSPLISSAPIARGTDVDRRRSTHK